MDDSKRRRIAGEVKRFCGRFAQGSGCALGRVIPQQSLMQWINEEAGKHRERVYGPLQTVILFIEQVLGADHSCQDAVARGVSQRVALGLMPVERDGVLLSDGYTAYEHYTKKTGLTHAQCWAHTHRHLFEAQDAEPAVAARGQEVYLTDPDVPIDTNPLERVLRAIPMGRKSWLFC